MKSIKEKAEEYGYANWQSDEYHDGASEGLEFDPIGHTQKTFEVGANYVLEEIEKLTDNQNWCAFPKQSHKELKELIEQLKKIKEQITLKELLKKLKAFDCAALNESEVSHYFVTKGAYGYVSTDFNSIEELFEDFRKYMKGE